MENFNQLLNDYVRRAGISDTELARALGVSRQTIFRWREGLTGRPRQREDVLVIARKLRLTPEERDKLLLAAGFRPEGGEQRGGGAGEQGSEETRTQGEEVSEGENIVSLSHASSPPLSRLRWPILVTGGLLALILAVWWMNGQPTDPPATSTPLITVVTSPPLRSLAPSSPVPAQPGETVILITHFANYASSQVGYNVAGRLAQALQEEIDQAGQANLRIVIWPEPVGERDEALQAGQTVSATLVIFGEYDVGRIVVEFAQPADANKFADPALQRYVAGVPDLSATINGDLPQQVRSLALIALGQIYLTRGQANQAQPLLVQAQTNLKNNPQADPQIWALANFYVGIAYQHGEPPQLDQTIAAYSQAIKAWPQMISSRLNRSAAYAARQHSGDLELALADADEVIRLRPEWAVAYNNRGSIRLVLGGAENLALALADLEKAVALDDSLPEAYVNRASVRFQQGLTMETVAPDFNKALALRPDYANVFNLFCWGYGLEQQPELAWPYCQQAITADPQPFFFDSRGLVYALQGDYPAAVVDFKRYADWLAEQPVEQQASLVRRRAWIKSLEAGQNPFTPQLLAELRAQFGR